MILMIISLELRSKAPDREPDRTGVIPRMRDRRPGRRGGNIIPVEPHTSLRLGDTLAS